MWLKLLAFADPGKPLYQRSDQAFIDEWKAAIDMYEKIFSRVTLVVTTGSGLSNLSATGFPPPPPAFSADCPNPDMDCAAETTILSYFERPSVGGPTPLSPLPVVKIGGVTATVTFAGLAAPGEFQFNVVVPANTPGDQPVTATYNGLTTPAGTLITIQ